MRKEKEEKLVETFPFLSEEVLDKIQEYVEIEVKDARIEVLTSDAQMERIRCYPGGLHGLYREE